VNIYSRLSTAERTGHGARETLSQRLNQLPSGHRGYTLVVDV